MGRLWERLRQPVLARTGLLSVLTLGLFAILVVTTAFGLLFGRYRDNLDLAHSAQMRDIVGRSGHQARGLTMPALTVETLESRSTESGYGTLIFGVARNDTDSPAPDVAVFVTWYEGRGKWSKRLVGTNPPSIPPHSKGTFQTTVDKSGRVTGVEARIEGGGWLVEPRNPARDDPPWPPLEAVAHLTPTAFPETRWVSEEAKCLLFDVIPKAPPGQGARAQTDVTLVVTNTCNKEVSSLYTWFAIRGETQDGTVVCEDLGSFDEPIPRRGRRTLDRTIWCDPDRVHHYRVARRG